MNCRRKDPGHQQPWHCSWSPKNLPALAVFYFRFWCKNKIWMTLETPDIWKKAKYISCEPHDHYCHLTAICHCKCYWKWGSSRASPADKSHRSTLSCSSVFDRERHFNRQTLPNLGSILFGYMHNFCLVIDMLLVRVCQLTDWGRVTPICVSKLTIFGSDNGLSPGRRQVIIWTNAGILLIRPLGTNFIEMLIEILIFSFMKMRLKVSSA